LEELLEHQMSHSRRRRRGLTDQQIYTFQGPPFTPSFVVEVDNLLAGNNETSLTDKFEQTYFPAGIVLGWLVDPVNRSFFVFMRDKDGVVRKRRHPWVENGEATTVSGRNVLPGFELKLWKVDEASSRVCSVSLLQHKSNLSHELQDDSESDSELGSSENTEIACPKCDKTFLEDHDFLEHYEDDHARRRRTTH